MAKSGPLQFVQVVVQSWDAFFETFTFACIRDNNTRLGCGLHGVSWEDLPVVEHALWEGLATGVGTQVSCEACDTEHYLKHACRRPSATQRSNIPTRTGWKVKKESQSKQEQTKRLTK